MNYNDCHTHTNDSAVCARCTAVECPYNTNPQADSWLYNHDYYDYDYYDYEYED